MSSYGIKSGGKVSFKDLGPQIGYRLVFIVEYAGPLLFVLAYAALRTRSPELLYGAAAKGKTELSAAALLGVACWCLHFLKREFETLFVHKFSRPTMPLSNLFKNCMYYWYVRARSAFTHSNHIFLTIPSVYYRCFGAVIGYPLCAPSYAAPAAAQVHAGLAIFALSELGNLICHIMLSTLRPADGSTKRPIPSGFLFNFVACPNYTFEVLSWVGFSIMTNIAVAYLFTAVGFYQMTVWALNKHKEYKKTYDKEYTSLRRKAIVPFLL